LLTVDGQAASADSNQHARVETGSGFGASADKVHDTIMSFLQGPPAGSNGAPPGAAGPNFTVFATPSPVQVANADAAEAGAASYTDPNGNPRVIAARLAIRGGTTYMLVIDSTADFYRTNPLLGQIEESFKLTTPTAQ